MTKDKSKFFVTDNLILASALKSKGFLILNIQKDNPRHSFFGFLQTNELTGAVRKYWSKTLLIEPMSFGYSMKELKTMLYDHSYEDSNYQSKPEAPPDNNPNEDVSNPEERRSSETYVSRKS